MYEKAILPNGLRILTVPMPHVRSVTIAMFLGAGSRYEADEEAGLSHFLEHMLFKGTQRRPLAQEISETIEGVGGYMNASTDREVTTYWAKVANHHFGTALDLLSDMVLNSVYDPTEMERERGVILEEIASVNDSPQQRADLLIDQVLWPDQPLGRDIAGTKVSVSSITRPHMMEYLGRQYAPSNAVLAVAGDLAHETVVENVAAHLGDWSPAEPRSWFPAVNGQESPRVRLQTQKTEQAHVCIAFPGLSSKHPDRYSLDLLNVILGEGMSSRLFVEIRERQGLAYDVHSYVTHLLDDGAVTIYAGVEPKKIDAAINAALSEVKRLGDGVPEYELRKAKEMIKGRLLLRTEDTRSMAGWVGAQELLRGEINTVDDIVNIIDAVQADDLQRIAGDIFNANKVNLAVVGPYRSEARFQRLVQ
jgi:predicted Zn-dependent peptidase